MTHDELVNTVAASTRDDWEIILCWGANSGPSFLNRFAVWKGPEDQWGLDHEQHAIRAAYKPDLSVGVAWGLDYMPGPEGEAYKLSFEWAKRFSDDDVTGSWFDAFWCGMLVYRTLLLSVDGGRAILPAPRGLFVPTSAVQAELVGESVTARELAIARLAHSFEHREEDFEQYLEIAGFVIEP